MSNVEMFIAAHLPLFFAAAIYRCYLSPIFIANISANRLNQSSGEASTGISFGTTFCPVDKQYTS